MTKGRLGFGLVALALVGCGGGASEPSDGAGFVLVDQEARSAGYALEIAQEGAASVLPVSGDQVVGLQWPGGRMALNGAAGELTYVRGTDGKLESRELGTEVDTARVGVVGDESAIQALADLTGADLVEGADGLELHGQGVLARLAELEGADGIDDVRPILMSGVVDQDGRGTAEAVRRVGAGASDGPSVFAAPDGIAKEAAWELDRLGVPAAVACADPVVGTWMGQVHDARYTDWYVFTLRVSRDASRQGGLKGTIEARSWMGGPGVMSPPDCDSTSRDFLVTMSATGTFDGFEMRFEGTSWAPTRAFCGSPLGTGEYNLDRFSGPISGAYYSSMNNDGGRMIDYPMTFRRVSCR